MPSSEYCVIPKVDAFALGYGEAALVDERIPSQNALHFVTSSGYGRGALIKMAQVDVGKISLEDVDFVTYDMLQPTGFDAVLGRSFLQGMKFQVDFPKHQFMLEKAV